MRTGDVERALRASLDEHARRAPDGSGLAERIIAEAALPGNVRILRPARSWRTWGLPLLAAAAVALVVGIGFGVSQWQLGASPHTRSGHSLTAPSPTPPAHTSAAPQPDPSPHSSVAVVAPPPASNPVGVAGFRVRDITFVGPNTGFAIGTARCTSGSGRCSAFVYTIDGTHWENRPNTTPFNVAGVSAGCASKCVDHVRFANAHTGYVYGPSYLAMTTDGGNTWTPQPGGALALETLDNNVIRLVSDDTGCPPCNFHVETSGVGSSTWTTTTLPRPRAGSSPEVRLARTGSDAYVLAIGHTAGGASRQQSTLYASTDRGLHWSEHAAPCPQGRAEIDGIDLAAAAGGISLVCQTRGALPPRTPPFVAISEDRGGSFARAGRLPLQPALLAGDPATVLVAAGEGAYRSVDGGDTWSHIADLGNAKISFLGFENRHDARAVTDGGRTIYTTHDAGRTWTPYTFH